MFNNSRTWETSRDSTFTQISFDFGLSIMQMPSESLLNFGVFNTPVSSAGVFYCYRTWKVIPWNHGNTPLRGPFPFKLSVGMMLSQGVAGSLYNASSTSSALSFLPTVQLPRQEAGQQWGKLGTGWHTIGMYRGSSEKDPLQLNAVSHSICKTTGAYLGGTLYVRSSKDLQGKKKKKKLWIQNSHTGFNSNFVKCW